MCPCIRMKRMMRLVKVDVFGSKGVCLNPVRLATSQDTVTSNAIRPLLLSLIPEISTI